MFIRYKTDPTTISRNASKTHTHTQARTHQTIYWY